MYQSHQQHPHYQHTLTQAEQAAAAAAMTPVPNYINRPIAYDSGPFAGRTIRVELIEVQKADLGRKFARRDRRPLDPPNVAEAFFYEVIDYGDDDVQEILLPAEEIDTDGLMCHVDVFPVVGNTVPQPNGGYPADPNVPPNLQIPPNEESKKTVDLWGASFSHAAKLPRCPAPGFGRPSNDPLAIYFPFPDLSVQSEGVFFFRYRVFDIKSHCMGVGDLELPIMAETYGGLCTVYSTKEFPGLKASTALTKHLSLHGIKVNLRETERKRTKRPGGGEDDHDNNE